MRDHASRRVLITPDGDLGLVPFDLLSLNATELLLDRYVISNINSGRDGVDGLDRPSTDCSEPAFICNPEFDVAAGGANPTAARDQERASDWREIVRSWRCGVDAVTNKLRARLAEVQAWAERGIATDAPGAE